MSQDHTTALQPGDRVRLCLKKNKNKTKQTTKKKTLKKTSLNLHALGLSSGYLDMIPIAQATKEKIDKLKTFMLSRVSSRK